MFPKMKILLCSLFSFTVFAVPCTDITRTNNGANTVLTSVKYNTDHNTAYTVINDIIGADCTIPFSVLTPDTAGPIANGVRNGCDVTRVDADTVEVSACQLTIAGNVVNKASATQVSFGCTGCSVEATATQYYLYANDSSDDLTLNLLILNSAPSALGYSGSERILGSFYNNGTGDIQTGSVVNYVLSRFEPKVKFQNKRLGSDVVGVVSSQALSDLTFSNLTIGNTYEIVLRSAFNASTAAAQAFIVVTHDGNAIGGTQYRGQVTSVSGGTNYATVTIPFTATAQTVTFVATANSGSTIFGNGTDLETSATIRELPNVWETDEW